MVEIESLVSPQHLRIHPFLKTPGGKEQKFPAIGGQIDSVLGTGGGAASGAADSSNLNANDNNRYYQPQSHRASSRISTFAAYTCTQGEPKTCEQLCC